MPLTTPRREPCINGGTAHAFRSLGLDVVGDLLVRVRRCVWCPLEQHQTYGRRRAAWRNQPGQRLTEGDSRP